VKDTHVMIDIETLGTKPGSVIASIGAVAFDPKTGEKGMNFYVEIDAHDAQSRGLTIDVGTFFFWLGQPADAQKSLTGRVPLDQALHRLTLWLDGQRSHFTDSVQWLWANSPDFDIVLLEAAYRVVGLQAPWTHRNRLDVRTLKHLTGATAIRNPLGRPHHALYDAEHQADIVIDGYERLTSQDWEFSGFPR